MDMPPFSMSPYSDPGAPPYPPANTLAHHAPMPTSAALRTPSPLNRERNPFSESTEAVYVQSDISEPSRDVGLPPSTGSNLVSSVKSPPVRSVEPKDTDVGKKELQPNDMPPPLTFDGGLAEYTNTMSYLDRNSLAYDPSAISMPYGDMPPGGKPTFSQEETASWLYQLVFQPQLDPQSILDESKMTEKDSHSEKSEGKVGSSHSEASMTVSVAEQTNHEDQHATSMQIVSVPSPKKLYGLSVRSTIKDLLGAWTYVEPGEVLHKVTITRENDDGVRALEGNSGYWSATDASITDDSDWEEVDENGHVAVAYHAEHPKPIERQSNSKPSNTSDGPPGPQIPQETKDRTSEAVEPSSETLRYQPISPLLIDNQLLEKLADLMIQFGDEMKKAEKARSQIEQFRKKEQDGKFRRLEELLVSQKEAWKAKERREKKAIEEARSRTAELQSMAEAEETARFKRLEELVLLHKVPIAKETAEQTPKDKKAPGETEKTTSEEAETDAAETPIETEAEARKRQGHPRGRSDKRARKQVQQQGFGWRLLRAQDRKMGEERGTKKRQDQN